MSREEGSGWAKRKPARIGGSVPLVHPEQTTGSYDGNDNGAETVKSNKAEDRPAGGFNRKGSAGLLTRYLQLAWHGREAAGMIWGYPLSGG